MVWAVRDDHIDTFTGVKTLMVLGEWKGLYKYKSITIISADNYTCISTYILMYINLPVNRQCTNPLQQSHLIQAN